jgi:hypothetical protein
MPEFHVVTVLLPSPVGLFVALWGMASKATLQIMKSSKQESLFPLKALVYRNKTELVPRRTSR